MAIAIDSQLFQIILEMIAQCFRSISLWIFCLQITYHLVYGTPCAHCLRLGTLCCLMHYLHVVLTDIGDIETMIVSKAHKKMTVFLALMLDLLDNTFPASHRTTENTDGIIHLDEVSISLVNNTQSLDAIGYLVIVIDEAFHIIIGYLRSFNDFIQCSRLAIGTKNMCLGEKGTLYHLGTSRTIINTLIHEVAILGKNALQTFFTLYSDEKQSLQDWGETYFFLAQFILVGSSSHRKVEVNNCIFKFLTQQIY